MKSLKEMKIWSIWTYKPDGNKIPCWPNGRWGLKYQDTENLLNYETARALLKSNYRLGITLPARTFLVDIDGVAATDPRIIEMLALFDSYSEISASSKGIHILVTCKYLNAQFDIKTKSGLKVEIKKPGTYSTISENVILDRPIRDATDILTDAYKEYTKTIRPRSGEKSGVARLATASSPYGLGALNSVISDLRQVTYPGRGKALYVAAVRLAELVAGGELMEHEARAALQRVGDTIGLDQRRIDKTLDNGFAEGRKNPRNAPKIVLCPD